MFRSKKIFGSVSESVSSFASSSVSNQPSQNEDIVIAVMGVTGFLFPKAQTHPFKGTLDVTSYPVSHNSVNYVLVDTPGFNDSNLSDEEVTNKILQWLEWSYGKGARLDGIIYLRNITQPRMAGSAYKDMRFFRQLVQKNGLQNVFLATSFWDQVLPSVGSQREQELKISKGFWAGMVAKGFEVVRIRPDQSICLRILEQVGTKTIASRLAESKLPEYERMSNDMAGGKFSRPSEIQDLEARMAAEKKLESEKFKRKLRKDDIAFKAQMKQLRAEQDVAWRREKQRQIYEEERFNREMEIDRQRVKEERLRIQRNAQIQAEREQQRQLDAEDKWRRNERDMRRRLEREDQRQSQQIAQLIEETQRRRDAESQYRRDMEAQQRRPKFRKSNSPVNPLYYHPNPSYGSNNTRTPSPTTDSEPEDLLGHPHRYGNHHICGNGICAYD